MAHDLPHTSASPDLRELWDLDPEVTFLNHGSFGACPRAVLEVQREWRARCERQPVLFLARELEGLLDEARGALGPFLGADPDDLAFLPNATAGLNTVLRALRFGPGDELLTTDHAYNAARTALAFAAERAGARVVTARVPFPLASPDEVVAAVEACLTPRTRLLVVDHVTSYTGLVFPIERMVRAAAARGVDTLVDAAHAPGMVEVDLERVGAAYTTGNCHKWLCAPKGAAFLHVRRDRQAQLRPLLISHGANAARTDRSRFRLEFDWTGTADPSAYLSVPAALTFLGGLLPGGWPALRAANHALVLEGRRLLLDALGIPAPAPASMLGSLVSVPLPASRRAPPTPDGPGAGDPLGAALWTRERIEVPVFPWPAPPRRLLRISAQRYNAPAQYARLAAALPGLLAEGL